jgi:hypothetical protein
MKILDISMKEGHWLRLRRDFFAMKKQKYVRMVVRQCQHCQLAKSLENIRSGIEEMKSILVCDLSYNVALDTTRPLPETKNGNKYALVAIDHYSKWCKIRPVKHHDVVITTRFLEKEIIYIFGVPKFIFIDNGGEWMAQFDLMCKKYGITHQSTMASMQWDGGKNDQHLEKWIVCGVIY